jgi:8-amino-7-oxononanoate synthase
MGDVLGRLRAAAEDRAAAGLRRTLTVRQRGGSGGLLDLASNDYLGLCGDPRVTAGAVAAAQEWGTGSTGSRLVTGSTALHARLEEALASFCGASAALVCSSGYLANLAVLTALATALRGGGVLIVSDERNHASLIDACRLARGPGVRLVVAPHRDVAAVRAALAGRTEESALVVSDSVFSVDGALAPVAALHAATRAHGALLVLDEAHALGVTGPGGRGAAAAAGLAAATDVVRTVTLSKSLAGQGGAILAAPEVIGTVTDIGRGFIFDTGLAPPSAGAALAALEVLRGSPELAAAALDSTRRLAAIAAQEGLGLASSAEVPVPQAAVVAVVLGDARAAVAARAVCAGLGVWVGCFRPPSVPSGQACLRLTGRASMAGSDLALAARALAGVRDHLVSLTLSPHSGDDAR